VPNEFKVINGRTVFENSQVHIWFCNHCGVWRRWQLDRCHICGALRDDDTQAPVGASGE
jgi:hypothetical protein